MPLDERLIEVMDSYLRVAKTVEPGHTDEWYRCKIVAANLKGLAEMLLEGLDRGYSSIDLQKTALGLLGTAAWLESED